MAREMEELELDDETEYDLRKWSIDGGITLSAGARVMVIPLAQEIYDWIKYGQKK